MKKGIAFVLLGIFLCLSFTACASTSSDQIQSQKTEESKVETKDETEEEEDETGLAETEVPGDTDNKNGTIHIGQTRLASTLSPYEGSSGWSLTSHGISETIYMQNEEGELYSRFISQIDQTDDHHWKIVLNEDVYFSDGSLVDAEAFCDAVNSLMEKNELCAVSATGKMKCTASGEFTLDVETENVTHILPCNLCEFQNVMFKDLGDGTFVYTGPYEAKELEADVRLDMTPNQYYPDAEKRPDVSILVFGDESSMKLAFEAKEIDMAVTVTANVVEMLENEGLKTETFDAGYQYFVYCNMESELMSDLAVRQAVNLALDREEMLTALKGGRVASGMFAGYYSFAGDCATERDLEGAKKLLDEAGWKLNGDGIREKDGKLLSLHFITYSSRPDLPILMQLAMSQLSELGIDFKAEVVEDITEACEKGDFDLCFYAQHTAPSGDPAYFLRMAFFPTEGGNDFSRYDSEAFRDVVDKMNDLPLGEERDALAKKAQQILRDDLPVIYAVDPQWHIAVSDKVEGYKPYCGDYYIVNSKLGID